MKILELTANYYESSQSYSEARCVFMLVLGVPEIIDDMGARFQSTGDNNEAPIEVKLLFRANHDVVGNTYQATALTLGWKFH